MKYVIENCWMILPGHKVGYGDIEIEGETIAGVAVRQQAYDNKGNRLVLPGLVNCHGHAAMTLVRGLGSGLPLQRWLEKVIFPQAKVRMVPGNEHVLPVTIPEQIDAAVSEVLVKLGLP